MENYICKVCGKPFTKTKWGEPYKLICSEECFEKNFWLEIIQEKEHHPVIDGTCYYLNRNDLEGRGPFKGCAGHHFRIRFLDTGEVVDTTNLWVNGDIPEEFRDRLPDTAEFLPIPTGSNNGVI